MGPRLLIDSLETESPPCQQHRGPRFNKLRAQRTLHEMILTDVECTLNGLGFVNLTWMALDTSAVLVIWNSCWHMISMVTYAPFSFQRDRTRCEMSLILTCCYCDKRVWQCSRHAMMGNKGDCIAWWDLRGHCFCRSQSTRCNKKQGISKCLAASRLLQLPRKLLWKFHGATTSIQNGRQLPPTEATLVCAQVCVEELLR